MATRKRSTPSPAAPPRLAANDVALGGPANLDARDVPALGIVPLVLRERGPWDPADECWGLDGEPIEDWARPIITRGVRPAFEFERVVPGADPGNFHADPIVEAAERRAAGDVAGARRILRRLVAQDVRCLDAHAHLGNLEFDRRPARARQHYEVGLAIAALTLGADFDGVLPWALVYNRPYLRCLHGAGLAAWRLRDVAAAKAVFTRMLWLNPSDDQGVRFSLVEIEAGRPWTDDA